MSHNIPDVCANVNYLLIDVELVHRAQLILERSQALPPAPRIHVNNVMGLLGGMCHHPGAFFPIPDGATAFNLLQSCDDRLELLLGRDQGVRHVNIRHDFRLL